MSEADMSNLMNQINSMLQNNEIPDDIKTWLTILKIPLVPLKMKGW